MSDGEATFTTAALGIARRLATEAIEDGSGLRWRGADLVPDGSQGWQVQTVDLAPNLYTGGAGIARFLGAAATIHPALRAPALAAARGALANGDATAVGLYTGALGAVIVAQELASRLDDPALRVAATTTANGLVTSIVQAPSAEDDLVDGVAGSILGLLALDLDGDARERTLVAVGALADRLVDRAQRRTPWGWWWRSAASENGGLASFAHGGSGVGLALRAAGLSLGNETYVEASGEAFRYERAWLSTQRVGWPDLRTLWSQAPVEPASQRDAALPGLVAALWCHGSVGVGLARLSAYSLSQEDWLLAEASAAIEAARRHVEEVARQATQTNTVPDASLCHGLAGVAELFLVAYEVLGAAEHLRAACRVGSLMLGTTARHGGHWFCGLPGGNETPGLFLGLAGIGLTLLRLERPSIAPSAALPLAIQPVVKRS